MEYSMTQRCLDHPIIREAAIIDRDSTCVALRAHAASPPEEITEWIDFFVFEH
jgi:hypothetical protein